MFEVKIDGAGGIGEHRPPWKYSETLQEVFRNVCSQRMQLLPYIYSCANTSYKSGAMMKPLAYVYPEDENTFAIWDEYIFGDAFLIAPVFEPGGERDIYLPAGKWHIFKDTGKTYTGNKSVSLKVPLNEIPVLIKGNSIYVTGDIFRGNSKIWLGRLGGGGRVTIRAFSGESNSTADFAYVDFADDNTEKLMTLYNEGGNVKFSSEPLSLISTIAVKCPAHPKEVMPSGKSADADYDEEGGVATVQVEANKGNELEMRF